MGWLEALVPFGGFFEKMADKLFPDKIAQEKERNAFNLAVQQMAQSGELEMLKTQLSAIIAEANSSDPWTSRARPSFMYVMYIMILASIPMGLVFAFKPEVAKAVTEGVKMWLTSIPTEMWTLFGVGYVGYAYTRSKEKIAGVTK